MSGCLFCRIINKEIPAKVVLETDRILVFHDIAPKAPVHMLVIPKEHIGSFAEIRPEHRDMVMDLVKGIQDAAETAGIKESGFRVCVNNGPNAGQAVPHLHFHVLGGKPLQWTPG